MFAAMNIDDHQSKDSTLIPETKTENGTQFNLEIFFHVAKTGNYERLKAMIQAGADVNTKHSKDDTSLLLVAEKGHDKCLDLLTKARADVNVRNSDGHTALMFVADRDMNHALICC